MPDKGSGSKDGQLSPQLAPEPENPLSLDPDLARVVAAWPRLPEHIRAAILALLTAAG